MRARYPVDVGRVGVCGDRLILGDPVPVAVTAPVASPRATVLSDDEDGAVGVAADHGGGVAEEGAWDGGVGAHAHRYPVAGAAPVLS